MRDDLVSSPDLHSEQSAAGPVVEVCNITVGFDGPPVLKDINFSVASGETRILLGAAGVGKSVLLKLVNGLVKPDQGSVLLFGEDIFSISESRLFALRARTGMVFQEGALFDSLTVRDNVGYQLLQDRRISDDEIDTLVHEALSFVGLEQTFSMFPASLSGGMRRRVAIARALINHPQLLLYDSPTGGLDPVTSTNIIELIMKERDVHGTPSIMVTHRLQDAFMLCTHHFDAETNSMVKLPKGQVDPHTTFLMLEEGRLIFDGTLHDLVHSDNPFVQEFLE
jgi:phospholipid/cholesterol/gamma-HCH transport system ATP-binding protein